MFRENGSFGWLSRNSQVFAIGSKIVGTCLKVVQKSPLYLGRAPNPGLGVLPSFTRLVYCLCLPVYNQSILSSLADSAGEV